VFEIFLEKKKLQREKVTSVEGGGKARKNEKRRRLVRELKEEKGFLAEKEKTDEEKKEHAN